MKLWLAAAAFILTTATGWAAPAYQGMSYTSFGQNELNTSRSDESLLHVSLLGTDTVALNFWWFQDATGSTTMSEDFTRYSSSVNSIQHAIDTIHGLGMKVLLKPMLDVKDGTWRANINPADKDLWFANYTNFLGTFADIAQAKNVELFSIGCELNAMENSINNQRWTNLINNVRSRYGGDLTYAANHDSGGIGGGYQAVPWWNQLDYIGIDAYFPLTSTASPSLAQLQSAWTTRANQIESWRASRGLTSKQVLFTEVGLGSYDGANMTPWASPGSQAVDEQEQANAYDALLGVMSQRTWWDGAFWWNWETTPHAGLTNTKGFTPQDKIAEQILANYYGGIVPPPPTSAWAVSGNGAFTTASNWTNGVPTAEHVTVFDRGPAVSYTVTLSSSRSVDQLRVRSNSVTFQSSSATARTLAADNPATGEADRGIIIGEVTGDVGVLTYGNATLTAISAAAATLGHAAGSSGALNLNAAANVLNITGSSAADAELIIGRAGSGTLNVFGGADVNVSGANGNVLMGQAAGSVGLATVSGAGSTWNVSQDLRIGLAGQAALTIASGGAVSAQSVTIGALGELRGAGSVTGNAQNSGKLSPGASPGLLSINGNYDQTAGGQLALELAGSSNYDRLAVTGNLSLAGAVGVQLIDGYSPQAGDSFDVLDWGMAFTDQGYLLSLPPLNAGLRWDAAAFPTTGVLAVVALPFLEGDFNENGVVDSEDLNVWSVHFAAGSAGHTQGDADNDMDVDGNDFLLWQRQLGSNTALSSATQAIPEPATGMAAMLLWTLLAAIRRRPAKVANYFAP